MTLASRPRSGVDDPIRQAAHYRPLARRIQSACSRQIIRRKPLGRSRLIDFVEKPIAAERAFLFAEEIVVGAGRFRHESLLLTSLCAITANRVAPSPQHRVGWRASIMANCALGMHEAIHGMTFGPRWLRLPPTHSAGRRAADPGTVSAFLHCCTSRCPTRGRFAGCSSAVAASRRVCRRSSAAPYGRGIR
jgi:hypothetical protein